jgi:transposase-like protein
VQALERFKIIRLFLEESIPLPTLAQQHDVSMRTLHRWVQQYQQGGLVTLCRKPRTDRGTHRVFSPDLVEVIEALALQLPRLSVATIARQVADLETQRGLVAPSYDRVYDVVRQIDPALLTTPHSVTGTSPQVRWHNGGFLPRMPASLAQLDLLLLTVAKLRIMHRDGIRFQGLRYIDLTLAAYIGERVTIRYDPRDMVEIRVYYRQRFLCRAVCQELAGETVGLKDIIRVRRRRKRELQEQIDRRQSLVDQLLASSTPNASPPQAMAPPNPVPGRRKKLKRYEND